MTLTHALFTAAVVGFALTLALIYWVNKLGNGLSLLGILLVFLISAAAVFLFITYAPDSIFPIAYYTGIGFVVLTLIISQISKS